MKREVLFKTITIIIDDLNRCQVPDFFRHFIESFRSSNGKENDESINDMLKVFKNYSIATHSYSKEALFICETLKISELFNINFWTNATSDGEPSVIYEMYNNIKFTINSLPKILHLIEQDFIEAIKNNEADIPEQLKGKSLLTVTVVEENNTFSSPIRLSNALESINNLYAVCATLENENENDLIVLACDSGSDKSFDFLGITKLTEQVKEIILSIWDRIVFHKYNSAGQNLELIAKSLPIIENIEELKKNNTLEPEQAELLKRQVINGATQFIKAGITIPELNEASIHNPRQLLKPEQTLIASKNTSSKKKKKKKTKE